MLSRFSKWRDQVQVDVPVVEALPIEPNDPFNVLIFNSCLIGSSESTRELVSVLVREMLLRL